jgi:HEAT repeat protein
MQPLSPPLKALLDRLPKVVKSRYDFQPEEIKLAEAIQKTRDPAAIPALLAYLKHPDEKVQNFAAYTLKDCVGFNPTHLNALIEADHKGASWLRTPIGRIGTPKAVAYLTDCMRRNGRGYASAFALLGAKGVPSLLMILSSPPIRTEEDGYLWYTLPFLFGGLDAESKKQVVRPLWEIVTDKRITLYQRKTALLALGRVDRSARRYIPAIQQLMAQEPEFVRSGEKALFSLGVPQVVAKFVQILKNETSSREILFQLRDFAHQGIAARAAGPDILACLAEVPWDMYWAIARTLGFIEYREATPALIALLKQPEDWRIVWAAADALGRLGAKSALPELERVAARYWYPAVRKTAQLAIDHIHAGKPYPFLDPTGYGIAVQFFRYESISYKIGWRTKPPANQSGVKFSVSDGLLVAKDDGEWGGELAFINKAGEKKQLIGENVRAIAPLETDIIAIGGLAHLGGNEGRLHRVVRDESGNWKAVLWRILPGAPEWAQERYENNRSILRVACVGGTVDVAPDGTIRYIG